MSTFSISIGDMRQSGTFRQNNPIPDGSGGFTDNYTDLLTTRGRLRKMKGSKNFETGEIVQNKSYEWVCRYQAALTINVDTILVISGMQYRIEDFEKVDEINHWIRFILNSFQ